MFGKDADLKSAETYEGCTICSVGEITSTGIYLALLPMRFSKCLKAFPREIWPSSRADIVRIQLNSKNNEMHLLQHNSSFFILVMNLSCQFLKWHIAKHHQPLNGNSYQVFATDKSCEAPGAPVPNQTWLTQRTRPSSLIAWSRNAAFVDAVGGYNERIKTCHFKLFHLQPRKSIFFTWKEIISKGKSSFSENIWYVWIC